MTDKLTGIPETYRTDIEHAIAILKEAGCGEIFLFGSLTKGGIAKATDIDLAVRGCPAELYFPLLGRLMMALEHPVDLIRLDRGDDFARLLETKGELLRVS